LNFIRVGGMMLNSACSEEKLVTWIQEPWQ